MQVCQDLTQQKDRVSRELGWWHSSSIAYGNCNCKGSILKSMGIISFCTVQEYGCEVLRSYLKGRVPKQTDRMSIGVL